MTCFYCLQIKSGLELYFYNKRQLVKYCEENNVLFCIDYFDDDTKVRYFKIMDNEDK